MKRKAEDTVANRIQLNFQGQTRFEFRHVKPDQTMLIHWTNGSQIFKKQQYSLLSLKSTKDAGRRNETDVRSDNMVKLQKAKS